MAPARIVRVGRDARDQPIITEAGRLLRSGALVAFPTETVYGLGANALDAAAVAGIFAAKDRPADNPVIIHVTGAEAFGVVARDVPEAAYTLAAHFWPGPLTLVLPRGDNVPAIVTANGATVAVRAPAHPVAQALLHAAGIPIAAPSANRSGRPSPTRAEHVAQDLGERIALILDGGATAIGVESTVLDLTREPPAILRQGAITDDMLRAVLPHVALDPHARGLALPDVPVRSPGMKHRHYAPNAPLIIHAGPESARALATVLKDASARNERVGLIVSTETAADLPPMRPGHLLIVPGPRTDGAAWAEQLFAALRSLDAAGVHAIHCEAIPEHGLGAAVMDRLRRAADAGAHPQ